MDSISHASLALWRVGRTFPPPNPSRTFLASLSGKGPYLLAELLFCKIWARGRPGFFFFFFFLPVMLNLPFFHPSTLYFYWESPSVGLGWSGAFCYFMVILPNNSRLFHLLSKPQPRKAFYLWVPWKAFYFWVCSISQVENLSTGCIDGPERKGQGIRDQQAPTLCTPPFSCVPTGAPGWNRVTITPSWAALKGEGHWRLTEGVGHLSSMPWGKGW